MNEINNEAKQIQTRVANHERIVVDHERAAIGEQTDALLVSRRGRRVCRRRSSLHAKAEHKRLRADAERRVDVEPTIVPHHPWHCDHGSIDAVHHRRLGHRAVVEPSASARRLREIRVHVRRVVKRNEQRRSNKAVHHI